MSQCVLRDGWYTPDEVFLPLEKEFGPFDLDVAASALNTKAKRYFTEEDDAIRRHWKGRVWCNPPYRDLLKWCAKAWHEVEQGRAQCVVMLLPAHTSTTWFHDYALAKASVVRFLRGKVKFGGSKGVPFFGSVVVVFGQ